MERKESGVYFAPLREIINSMPQTGKIIFITIVGWLVGSTLYGYFWVTSILAQPDNYGYEKWVMFPLMGFLVYRFPYLVVGLILVILTELIVIVMVEQRAGER